MVARERMEVRVLSNALDVEMISGVGRSGKTGFYETLSDVSGRCTGVEGYEAVELKAVQRLVKGRLDDSRCESED